MWPRRVGARTLVVLPIGLALAAACAAAAPGAQARTAPARAASPEQQVAAAAGPHLNWRSCGRDAPGFQCTRAHVPLDYDDPRGATISLALTRLPATGRRGRIGSAFFDPGGPGGSGVSFLQAVGRDLYSREVRARFDLIGFDPRGVGTSRPLQCFDTTQQAIDALPPFAFPYTRAEEAVQQRTDRRLAQACVRRAGAVLDHMSTANVARDMDLLRRAVGDAKMTYVGYSYGSYIGSTYANMFPDRVRAIVIDGVIDPISDATGRGDEGKRLPVDARLRSEQGAYQTLQELLRLCDRYPRHCAFSAGDAKTRYDRLAQRLLAHPVRLPDGSGGTVLFGYDDLVAATLGSLYSPTNWPELADLLQQLWNRSSSRSAVALAALYQRLGVGPRATYQQVLEGFLGVWCTDSVNPDSFAAWARSARAADRRDPYFGRAWIWSSSVCAVWPGADRDRYLGPFNRPTANDVLVVGNIYDPATRYQDAVSTAKILSRGRLLTVAGWGHTSLFMSSCADRHVSRYLLTGRVPAEGTVCPVDEIPFQRATPPASTTVPSLLSPALLRPLRQAAQQALRP